MVDNCYGEFVQEKEPTQVGADLIIGSLIKNPGGGIAPTRRLYCRKSQVCGYVRPASECAGVGKEVGCTLGNTRSLFMGLFFAPTVVASAVKTATFAASLYELLGYEVTPSSDEIRADIIQAVCLQKPEALIAFCEGVQKGSTGRFLCNSRAVGYAGL